MGYFGDCIILRSRTCIALGQSRLNKLSFSPSLAELPPFEENERE